MGHEVAPMIGVCTSCGGYAQFRCKKLGEYCEGRRGKAVSDHGVVKATISRVREVNRPDASKDQRAVRFVGFRRSAVDRRIEAAFSEVVTARVSAVQAGSGQQ